MAGILIDDISKDLEAKLITLIRRVVREETKDLRVDVGAIKGMLGNQGMRLQLIESELRSTKQVLRTNGREMSRLGQLLEDLEDRFSGTGEFHSA